MSQALITKSTTTRREGRKIDGQGVLGKKGKMNMKLTDNGHRMTDKSMKAESV